MKHRFLLLCVAMTVALGGCGDLFDPAAAAVSGRKITIEEVDNALEKFEKTMRFQQLAAEEDDANAIRRQFEQGFLAQTIRRRVFEPQANELGIEVTDDDVQARLDEIRSGYPSDGAFEEALREQGLTVEDLELLVRDRTLEEDLRAKVTKGIGASEAELRDYYDTHLQEFTVMQARHILVEKRKDAKDVQRQLKEVSGSERRELFAKLARKLSIDRQSAESGGNLGPFASGDFVKSFEDAAYALQVRAISAPVKSEFGWHVIQLLDRDTDPFDVVRDEIDAKISGPAQEEAWTEWVVAAYESADVEVNSRYGELDLETQLILDPSAESIPGGEVPETETPTPAPSL